MTTKSKKGPWLARAKRLIIQKPATRTLLAQTHKITFQRSSFSKAPSGDRYEWKAVETVFTVPRGGLFAIKIEASAKNAAQNGSTNDDDLRVALDGFDFGKYEVHEEQVSWKGFGTSASWDGASLKGGIKTIYFFVELGKGSHALQFFADQTPTLKNIEISELINNEFELTDLKPIDPIKSDIKGIPWLAFVFLGSLTKTMTLGVRGGRAKDKKTSDGDNLKVVVNGDVLQNSLAPTASRYKNFYFSANLKKADVLTITHEDFSKPLAFENAVELWYDEEPEITNLRIEFLDEKTYKEYLRSLHLSSSMMRATILRLAHASRKFFKLSGKKYSEEFLRHALKKNPKNLIFKPGSPLVKKIQEDLAYRKILEKLKEKIRAGILEGEILPKDFKNILEMGEEINFESSDLKTSLHGIHKIHYKAMKKNNHFDTKIIILDIYDFHRLPLPSLWSGIKAYMSTLINNQMDAGEILKIIHNFEIEIHIYEKLEID